MHPFGPTTAHPVFNPRTATESREEGFKTTGREYDTQLKGPAMQF